MAVELDLIIEDERWAALALRGLAEKAIHLALDAAGLTQDVEVSLLATDDARIARLNSEFRGKSKATNVLSWPAYDLFPNVPGEAPVRDLPESPFGPPALGDIALAYETVMREAEDAGRPAEHHIIHLILHGALHLLGYDHETEPDAHRMEGIEIRTLASLGIDTPY